MISGTDKERGRETMTKHELIQQAAKAAQVTQETAGAIIAAALDAAADALARGDAITIRDFGTLEARQRKGRTIQLNGKANAIPAYITAAFVPAKALKDKLNGEA